MDIFVMREYKKLQQMQSIMMSQGYQPLTFQDSNSHVPNYPFCSLGVLNAKGEWGTLKGVAFVVQDNYLLTCASNCYSHQYGEYPDITLTINSNRKHGYDTHKIAKVFIPQQYKTLSQDQRKQFNYALLFVEGQQNFKARYGSLEVVFSDFFDDGQIYFQCSINNRNRLHKVGEHSLNNNIIFILNGTPRIGWKNSYPQVHGMLFQEEKDLKTTHIRFNRAMRNQITQWIQIQKGIMELSNFVIIQATYFLKNWILAVLQVLKKGLLRKYPSANTKQQTFQKLPFSSILSLEIHRYQTEIEFSFLKMDKFKNLQCLWLIGSVHGPIGCKRIVEIALPNLRQLNLQGNHLGNEGCEYLSAADWPFLQSLTSCDCDIRNEGLQFLVQNTFKNLHSLLMTSNKLGQNSSKILELACFPRINSLYLSHNSFFGLELTFLKLPVWQSLIDIDLCGNPVGNIGCKMIKQAGLSLRNLELESCLIGATGVKWLCKANMSRINNLVLNQNDLGDQACFYFSKANFSCLQSLEIGFISAKGLRLLLNAQWRERAFYNLFKNSSYIFEAEIVLFLSSFKGKISDEIFLKALKSDKYEIFLKISKVSQEKYAVS